MNRQGPRIALFTDSFHEVNGVALTCRQFEAYAATHDLPMFSCHAGPEQRTWQQGSITRCEWKRSSLAVRLEADLSFDVLFWRQLSAIRERLREFQPDFVHVTSPGDCSLLGLILAYELGIPVAASWHTNVHEFGARRLDQMVASLPKALRRKCIPFIEDRILDISLLLYQRAKLLFAPNPALVQLLSARTGTRCTLMSRGIDTARFSPEYRDRNDSAFRIGYVGRLSPEKNLRLFVDLERELAARGCNGVEYVFVGWGGELPHLKSAMRRAQFTGVLKGEALSRAYADFDLFVFPSTTDTFGNVVLEALASGVPAIVSGFGGPQYIVRHGHTGFIARDTSEFVGHAHRLINDRGALAGMSACARDYALSHHRWDVVFDTIYSDYRMFLRDRDLTAAVAAGPVATCR